MRHVAAYLLAVLGGNKNPSADDLKKILGSVGVELDKAKADKVIAELKGKDIEEVIKKGSEKLASVPSGGAAAAAAPAAGGAASAPAKGGSPAKEDKKAKKEESEEEDDDMGFGLFD